MDQCPVQGESRMCWLHGSLGLKGIKFSFTVNRVIQYNMLTDQSLDGMENRSVSTLSCLNYVSHLTISNESCPNS